MVPVPDVEYEPAEQGAVCPVVSVAVVDPCRQYLPAGQGVHAAVAAGCAVPCDIIGHVMREDDLIVHPIPIINGFIRAPVGPGLGVELDLDAVDKYRVA